MKMCCGNCNFRGDMRPGRESKVRCMRSDIWHSENDSCAYWKTHDPSLTAYERLKLARSPESDKREYRRYMANLSYSSMLTVVGIIVIILMLYLVVISTQLLVVFLQ